MNEVVWHTGKPPRPKAGGCQYLCTVDFAGGLRQVMAGVLLLPTCLICGLI